MIIHCTRYAGHEVDFWLVVTTANPSTGTYFGDAIFWAKTALKPQLSTSVVVENIDGDDWEIVPDDQVPDYVMRAFGEWALAR